MDEKLLKEIQKERRNVILTIIGGLALMVVGIMFAYFGTVGSNAKAISNMEGSKVDQEKFNEFLNLQNKYNVLMKERQDQMFANLGVLDDRQRKIEIERLKEIEIDITKLEEQMRILLDVYGLKVRGGEDVLMPIEWFIEDIPKT